MSPTDHTPAPSKFQFAGDHVVGPDGTSFSFDWAIDQLPWRDALPASGMPAHQYVVIDDRCQPAADVLSGVIAVHPESFNAFFRGYQRPMRYLELGDRRYWRTSLHGTQMLNRCTFDSVEPPRRVSDGAVALQWDGPPWALKGEPWPPGYVEDGDGRWVYHREVDPRQGYICTACGRAYWLSAPERPCPNCGHRP